LHLNPLQRNVIQPKGDTNFEVASKIHDYANKLPVPIATSECGISTQWLRRACGVTAISGAGFGGTSWSKRKVDTEIYPTTTRWGVTLQTGVLPTSQCITEYPHIAPSSSW